MSVLYEKIAEQCSLQGITGYRLCKDCGISPSVITDLKNGRKKTLSADYVVRIAERLGVSTEYLLGKNENKPAHEEGELINGDRELTEYLQELASRDEMRMLFHVTKNATKEQIEAIVKMVEAMKDSGIL